MRMRITRCHGQAACSHSVIPRAVALLLLLLVVTLLMGTTWPALAKTQNKTVVRVGFPIQNGSSYVDEEGNYAGYLVDYLHQLNLFTNWEIEFVQVDGDLDTQLSTLMQMLQNGDIDMLGTMNRNQTLEELFLYPSYSYGFTYTVLAVQLEDLRWIEEDFSNWQDIRVATFPGTENRMKKFNYYAAVNNFSFETVPCSDYEEMVRCVLDGQADAMIQADISLPKGFRIIGRYAPTPYYFALAPDNSQLLQELDTAMHSLNCSQPNLQTELYDNHFRILGHFQVSQEHRDYIDSLGTLNILFFRGDAPYQYERNGALTGFAKEYLDNFAQITGLEYEPILVDSYEQAQALIQQGQVDLVACVSTNSSLVVHEGMRFTVPYLNSFSVAACSNATPHKHDGDLEFQANTQDALDKIKSKENLALQLDYYSMSYYLRKSEIYSQVVIDWTGIDDFSYVFGVSNEAAQDLIPILNQYIGSTTDASKQTILFRYLAEELEYSFSEWLYANRLAILCVCILVVSFSLIYAFTLRSKRIAYKALLAENKLMHLAMYDELTGAYNESYFRKLLQERCDKREPGMLAVFDILGFKYINDIFGVKRANDVLCSISSLVDERLEPGEFFCRCSADQFCLLLNATSAWALNTRILDMFASFQARVAEPLDGHPLTLYCGAVNISQSPAPYSVEGNMSYVMAALAHAKQIKHNGAYVFDEALYQSEQLRYYIETHMRSALTHGEYRLYLQPKKNLLTGKIDAAEALARWQSQERGMIYPNQFIPIFEENGFCMQLDLFMVEQVCMLLRNWMDAGRDPLVISVNQTKSLFVRDDYVERLLAITEKYSVDPQYIVLEITEGLAFDNVDSLNATIRNLNRAGFRVSMDDFGSGYSSLNTLGKLQINELKIDHAFVQDAVCDPKGSQSMVLSVILTLARRLGVKTVAEGVETEEGEALIRAMACDYGQGYYYGKPIPAEEFAQTFCA